MTIAACYITPEAVVFGADSATTFDTADGRRHYNYAQKVFEIGKPSTLGIVTWGMGALPSRSHRTLIAEFSDHLRDGKKLDSIQEVAAEWVRMFWAIYESDLAVPRKRAKELHAKGPFGDAQAKKAHAGPHRTEDEEKEYGWLSALAGGYILGGNLMHARTPQAFVYSYEPFDDAPRAPEPVGVGEMRFAGCPNIAQRLFFGADPAFQARILASPHWTGRPEDLQSLLTPSALQLVGALPLREAVDWVHATIYTTIKMMKFSQMPHLCGGPVEVAVITSDREFRWVRHKSLGAAVELDRSNL